MPRVFTCSTCRLPCTLVAEGAGVPDSCPYSDSPYPADVEWRGGHTSRRVFICHRCPGNAVLPKLQPCVLVTDPKSDPPRNCPWSDFPPLWEEVDTVPPEVV